MADNSGSLRYSALFKLKIRLLLITFFLRYFLIGAEYSVILPSVLLYMKIYRASYVFMGIVVASYPLACIISLPIVGYIYDRTKRVKMLLLVLNSFQVLGNILYCLKYSKWLPVVGRFVAGLGDGFITLVVGEVTFLYPRSERIGIFSILEVGRVLGIIIGPIVNYFVEEKSITVKGWTFDSNTIPGAAMAAAWVVMQIVTILFSYNVTKEMLEIQESLNDEKEIAANERDIYDGQTSFNLVGKDILNIANKWDFDRLSENSDEPIVSPDRKMELRHDKKDIAYWSSLRQLFSIEFFIFFIAYLVISFSQTTFEILIPFITEFNYGWNPELTGAVYMFASILFVIIFLLLYCIGGKLVDKDPHMLILSLVFIQLSFALQVYETTLRSYTVRMVIFGLISFLIFASVPLNIVSSKALLTKIFIPEVQGIIQGILSGISRFAMIGGPLLSGLVFEHRWIYCAIGSLLCFFSLLGMYWCLGRLSRRQQDLFKWDYT